MNPRTEETVKPEDSEPDNIHGQRCGDRRETRKEGDNQLGDSEPDNIHQQRCGDRRESKKGGDSLLGDDASANIHQQRCGDRRETRKEGDVVRDRAGQKERQRPTLAAEGSDSGLGSKSADARSPDLFVATNEGCRSDGATQQRNDRTNTRGTESRGSKAIEYDPKRLGDEAYLERLNQAVVDIFRNAAAETAGATTLESSWPFHRQGLCQ